MKYESYIIRSVLTNNEFGITKVDNLESICTRGFVKEEYSKIEQLINDKNINAIKNLPKQQDDFFEFIDILIFKDQNKRNFFVTAYDSNELSQDPQVIKIYIAS